MSHQLRLRQSFLIIIILTFCGLSNHWPQDASVRARPSEIQEITQLESGATIVRSIAGGQTHNYKISLTAGQFFHAVVYQEGIDLRVSISAPEGNQNVLLDRPNGLLGPEAISLVAQHSGDYLLQVRPVLPRAQTANYRLRTDSPRPAEARDQLRINAERALSDGEDLRAKQTIDLTRQGIEQFSRAVGLWQELGDRYEEALAHFGLGLSHRQLGENQKAIIHFGQALALMRELGDRYGEALSRTSLS